MLVEAGPWTTTIPAEDGWYPMMWGEIRQIVAVSTCTGGGARIRCVSYRLNDGSRHLSDANMLVLGGARFLPHRIIDW